MPIYEYNCPRCEADFELLVRGEERPACPDCGTEELAKRFSVPAAHMASGQGSYSPLPMMGSCGRPQCGQGGCQGLE